MGHPTVLVLVIAVEKVTLGGGVRFAVANDGRSLMLSCLRKNNLLTLE